MIPIVRYDALFKLSANVDFKLKQPSPLQSIRLTNRIDNEK